jgi:hypothetical protein
MTRNKMIDEGFGKDAYRSVLERKFEENREAGCCRKRLEQDV